MKFRNKKKFRYGIPVSTGPFRALFLAEDETPCSADSYQLSARCSLLDTAFQSMKALLSKGENGII
jgi:hypothetical protein